MRAAREPQVVKVSSLDDIVAAVPHLLGFHPQQSLVAVALKPPRDRMAFTARIDLEPEEHDPAIAAYIADVLVRAEAEAAFIFVYTDAPDADTPDRELPRQALVEELQRALPMPTRDAVLVAAGRVWSYLCPEPDCCPPEGRPLDPSSPGAVAMAAAHALDGRAVLADRESVVRSIAPLGGIVAAALHEAYDRADAELDSLGDDADVRRVMQGRITELVARYRNPPASLTADEAAIVVLALHDVLVRDDVLTRVGTDDDDALLLFLVDLARRALPPFDAPALTCLAWACYAAGDGLRAAAALERALAADPGYSMAQLVSSMLNRQIHPRELRDLAAQMRRSLRRSRRR
jgi:hypothetical protein